MGNNCTKGTKGGDPSESMDINEYRQQSTLESDYTGTPYIKSSLSS